MATYTDLTDLDLPALAELYQLADPAAQPLKGGAANSSFRLDAGGRTYVLTSLDNHDLASARHLAGVTRAVGDLGLPTVRVIANRHGQDISVVGSRAFLLKEMIEGSVQDPLLLEHVDQAGELLATLHCFPSTGLDLPVGTRRLSSGQRGVLTSFPDQDFAHWMTTRLETIGRHEADHKRAPVPAHGDLFADNLIVRPGGNLSVIDWETISLDDPLLDLGMAAVGLCQDTEGRLSRARLSQLLAGYGRLRPLSAEDRAELPTEIVHAALIIAFHRYHRHVIRFPDPARAEYHRLMVAFADSVPDAL